MLVRRQRYNNEGFPSKDHALNLQPLNVIDKWQNPPQLMISETPNASPV